MPFCSLLSYVAWLSLSLFRPESSISVYVLLSSFVFLVVYIRCSPCGSCSRVVGVSCAAVACDHGPSKRRASVRNFDALDDYQRRIIDFI